MAELSKQQKELFAKYLGENKICVVDLTSSARTGIARAMVEMGAKTNLISLFDNFYSAEDFIRREHPKILVSDYYLGPRSGFDLLDVQKREQPKIKDSLFILVTGNSTESTVARAAEEDVDSFILKPYTMNSFRNTISTSAIAKLFPSAYIQAVEIGKEKLFSGDPDGAIAALNQAATLDPKPTLALFYRGQAETLKEAMEQAKECFETGLAHNKIHFKCLVGLFDLLMEQKKFEEAYKVVKRIAQYFPANPKRLCSVLRLAIVTASYTDIELYYEMFTSIDVRSDDLLRYMCAALITTGKYYLRQDSRQRASEVFQKVGVSAAGKTAFYRLAVENLIEYNMVDEAYAYLKRFPADEQKDLDYSVANYLILDKKVDPGKSVEMGRELIKNGHHNSSAYRALLKRLVDFKIFEQAEELIGEATQRWPDESAQFTKILSLIEERKAEKKAAA